MVFCSCLRRVLDLGNYVFGRGVFSESQHRVTTEAHRVTPYIFGISPGSIIAYDTPLNVVPTSSAITRERVEPP